MNILQTIINYYHGEARHGFWAAAIGGILLIGSMAIWKWAAPLSLFKGLAIPMFLFGSFTGIGGGVNSIYANKAAYEKIALYQKDPAAFLKQEKVKTEKTHQGWNSIRIFWGILGLIGIALSLLVKGPFWMGASLGTVALAIFLSLFEFYSMRFNEKYYHTIQSISVQQTNINIRETRTDAEKQVETDPILMDPHVSEHQHTRSGTSNLRPDSATRDSSKALRIPVVNTIIIKDQVSFSMPPNLKILMLTNDVTQVSHLSRTRDKGSTGSLQH